jgi:integrase
VFFFAGLRVSEARALRPSSIDPDAGVIRVRHAWTRYGDAPEEAKSHAGARDVPIVRQLEGCSAEGCARYRDEAAEEDRRASVAGDHRLGAREHAVAVPAKPVPALEQCAAADSADEPIAEVVADDGGCSRD